MFSFSFFLSSLEYIEVIQKSTSSTGGVVDFHASVQAMVEKMLLDGKFNKRYFNKVERTPERVQEYKEVNGR